MTVYAFDPLEDQRWADFVQTHTSASIFHTQDWLEALRLTYGFEPVVLTTSPPEAELTNGIVFCRVSSWLTGRRLVSLPFVDHCEPLLGNAEDGNELFSFVRRAIKTEKWKYIEIRPRTVDPFVQIKSQEKGASFCFHMLDLRPDLKTLFSGLQKSSIQRMIRRAEREGLSCEQGQSTALLDKFYGLMLKTRRRHKLPPQPISWFRNLLSCLGDRLSIRVAFKNVKPIASILTLTYRNTLVYKYGCSDANFHYSGAVPFLLWNAIQEAKNDGLEQFDMGRSDFDNPGLIVFKNRWGAQASTLEYVRFSALQTEQATANRGMQMARRLFACMPDGLLTAAGKLLYRHIG
jgi:GNAT acetyltransferase-like protein